MRTTFVIALGIMAMSWLGLRPEAIERADLLAREAENALLQSDPEAALELLDRAIELSPEAAEYRLARAEIFARIGRSDDRLRDLHKACDLAPDSADCHAERGRAFLQFGNVSDAISDFDRALHLSPERAEIYHARGVAQDRLGNHDQAQLDFARALALLPGGANLLTAATRIEPREDQALSRR